VGIVSHFYLSAEEGFSRGFESYIEITSRRRMHKIVTSKRVSDEAIAWLKSYASQGNSAPFFMFLHYFDPHFNFIHHPDFRQTKPYNGPVKSGMDIRELRRLAQSLSPEDLEYLVGLYHEEIAFTDHHIGRVLNALEEMGLSRQTLIIFVADHGEEFMEHGWIGHARTLYDELIHVPLVFYLPGVFRPVEIDTPVSQVDIFPTVLAMSLRPLEAMHPSGESLLPYLFGRKEAGKERSIVSEVSFNSAAIPNAYKTALIRGNLKIIHDITAGTWELYDLAEDPGEQRNLVKMDAEESAKLAEIVRLWEKQEKKITCAPPSTENLAPQEIEQLRSLGYM